MNYASNILRTSTYSKMKPTVSFFDGDVEEIDVNVSA